MDYIDESGVLTPTDYENHINKQDFTVPFVCGATNLSETSRHTSKGAAMIRSKGEAGTGDAFNAIAHMHIMTSEINRLASIRLDEVFHVAKELQAPYPLVKEVAETGKLPAVLFTADGIATPADAALIMQLETEGMFVGSGIFKSGNSAKRAVAIAKVTARFNEPELAVEVPRSLGEAMVGISVHDLPAAQHLENWGWQVQINLKNTGTALLRTQRSHPADTIHKEGR